MSGRATTDLDEHDSHMLRTFKARYGLATQNDVIHLVPCMMYSRSHLGHRSRRTILLQTAHEGHGDAAQRRPE